VALLLLLLLERAAVRRLFRLVAVALGAPLPKLRDRFARRTFCRAPSSSTTQH
jgi:hypothetical protein